VEVAQAVALVTEDLAALETAEKDWEVDLGTEDVEKVAALETAETDLAVDSATEEVAELGLVAVKDSAVSATAVAAVAAVVAEAVVAEQDKKVRCNKCRIATYIDKIC